MYYFLRSRPMKLMQKKQLFAGEMVQIQEAISRCRYRINQLGNDQSEQLSKEQENLRFLEERMRQVLESYDSCTEES